MKTFRALALGAVATLAVGSTSAQAATMLAARADSLCGSGGCFADRTTFQQTFSAASFGGSADIGGLALQRGILGAMEATAFKVSFELTDGTKVADWGHFTVAVLGGETVRLGGDAFTWDTTRGDLVLKLDLVVPDKGGGGGGGGGFGGAFAGGGLAGGAFDDLPPPRINLAGEIAPSANPIARIAATAVPEPGTWALMLAGFGGAGAMLRRKRQLASKFG